MEQTADVVVVGGGFAGLTAARELSRAGVDVVLVEARDRLGGRTQSTTFGGHLVELGGAWVHWFQPHVWAEMTRYGLGTRETPYVDFDEYVWLVDGERRTAAEDAFWGMARRAADAFFADAREVVPEPHSGVFTEAARALDSRSVQDRVDELALSEDERGILVGTLTGLCNAPLKNVGLLAVLRWYALAGWDLELLFDAGARYSFAEGTQSLVDGFAEDLRGVTVRLSTEVSSIEDGDDDVRVTTSEGAILARAVVVTVPLNTLERIRFQPDLAGPRASLRVERQASMGMKTWVLTEAPVHSFYGVGGDSDVFHAVSNEGSAGEGSLLLAFSADGFETDPLDTAAVEAGLQAFVPGVRVKEVLGHNWSTDELSAGTWSMFRPGQATGFESSLREPAGRVFYASSDIARGWNSFIDGAIEQGFEAARKVRQHLG